MQREVQNRKTNTLNNNFFIIIQSNNIEISSQFNINSYLYLNTKKNKNKCLKRIFGSKTLLNQIYNKLLR